jgi:hypothetical protein
MATTPPAVVTRVNNLLHASLDPIADGPSKTAGIQIRADAATAMLAARSTDGRFDSEPFTPSDALGKWRLVPPLNANVFGQFATVTPLTIKSPDQFRTEGRPDLKSAAYAAELNEVKMLGAQSGSSRTDAQTRLAGFATANPLFYMNKGLRDIAVAQGLSTSQQARLFVMTSMAAADALIGCWNNKAYWHSWRPQTAIREAANDGTTPRPRTRTGSRCSRRRGTRRIRLAITAIRARCGTARGCSSGPTRSTSSSRALECRRIPPPGIRSASPGRPGRTRG